MHPAEAELASYWPSSVYTVQKVLFIKVCLTRSPAPACRVCTFPAKLIFLSGRHLHQGMCA